MPDLRGGRGRAPLLVGLAATLAAPSWSPSTAPTWPTLQGLVVTLHRSKTDQEGGGGRHSVATWRGQPNTRCEAGKAVGAQPGSTVKADSASGCAQSIRKVMQRPRGSIKSDGVHAVQITRGASDTDLDKYSPTRVDGERHARLQIDVWSSLAGPGTVAAMIWL